MARWTLVPSPLDEVLEAFHALLDARRHAPVPAEAGRGNFRCERCEDCSHCRFCNDCTACEDCTYCDGCVSCTACTHCKHCTRCKQTTHSNWSSECSESSYLTLCLDCKACVQCFACVGLQNEEFCVLNEKLPRKAYFSRVAALRGALEERMASGWRPPWDPVPAVDDDAERTPLPVPEPEAQPEARDGAPPESEARAAVQRREDEARAEAQRREDEARVAVQRREDETRAEAQRREDEARAEAQRREDAARAARADVQRREDAAREARAEAQRREDAAREARTEALLREARAEASRSAAMLRTEPAGRFDLPRREPTPARSELLVRAEATRRDDTAPVIEDSPNEPVSMRADHDSRASLRSDPIWEPPPARMPDPDDRAGRSEITVDVIEDDEPRGRPPSPPPWSFADARRGRPGPSEPVVEQIPEPPPFGSGAHPMAKYPAGPVAPPEEGSVTSRANDEPTRRRERARPMDPPRDRYGWSAQAEGTPVRMGWSVQAEREPERLSWSTPDDEPARPDPRVSRWSSVEEGSGRWSRPREEPSERSPKRPAPVAEARSPWPPNPAVAAEDARPERAPKADTDPGPRRAWPPRSPTDPGESPGSRAPKATEAGVPRQAWTPKSAPELMAPRPSRQKSGWDGPPGTHRDPHENDFDRRRRETAALPLASDLDLDKSPVAYGRDRPFDPEPPLQLDVWSAYEQIHQARLKPDEQTEPDAPVARRGPARADLSGSAAASAEDPARRSDSRASPRSEAEDTPADASALSRSLGVARRPERPRPPEPRERGSAMLRGRAPARPAPPIPTRQPDAPSLRRARRPSRTRDESTSEYLAADGPVDDPEQS